MLRRALRLTVPLLFLFSLASVAGCRDTRRTARDSGPNPFSDGGACGGLTMCGLGCADLTSDPANCGACGQVCELGLACVGGSCGECTPNCFGLECGSDGCGGSCGTCGDGFCDEGLCEEECSPFCGDSECGDDGCGGSCGTCGFDSECIEGFCSGVCEPTCDGVCGPDGCGGTCGTCSVGVCVEGECMSSSAGESCASPILVSTVGSTSFSLEGRTLDHANDCASSPGSDVVFAVTPSTSGLATFETTGSFDLALAVYDSPACVTQVGCDDDDGTGSNPLLEFSVSAFTTYYVVVSPYSGASGSGEFVYSLSPG